MTKVLLLIIGESLGEKDLAENTGFIASGYVKRIFSYN